MFTPHLQENKWISILLLMNNNVLFEIISRPEVSKATEKYQKKTLSLNVVI